MHDKTGLDASLMTSISMVMSFAAESHEVTSMQHNIGRYGAFTRSNRKGRLNLRGARLSYRSCNVVRHSIYPFLCWISVQGHTKSFEVKNV